MLTYETHGVLVLMCVAVILVVKQKSSWSEIFRQFLNAFQGPLDWLTFLASIVVAVLQIQHFDSHHDNLYLPDMGSPMWLLRWPTCMMAPHCPSHWRSPSFTSYSFWSQLQLIVKSNQPVYHNFLIHTPIFPLSWPWYQFGEGNGNPLQYSSLENPRDGGAW